MLALVCTVLLSAGPRSDPRLVGTWLLMGHPFMTLDAGGKGTMEEDTVSWSADGKTLTLKDQGGEADQGAYQVEGDALTLNLAGTSLVLTRKGGAAPAGKPGPLEKAAARARVAEGEAATPPGKPGKPGGDPLSKLVVSSAWCSFSYNKISGTSRTERVVFSPDGTWSTNARGEGYSAGQGGTFASQHDSGGGGRWEVRQGVMFMSQGDGPLGPVQGTVTQNSNGFPIINANGREYSSCN